MAGRYALLSKQGTACAETVLTEAEYRDPSVRARIEREAQGSSGPDAPVLGTWTEVSENEHLDTLGPFTVEEFLGETEEDASDA
jgi:hypothetical protein